MSQERSLRLFVAIDLPPPVRSALERTIAVLRESGLGPLRWVAPKKVHLTLKFLGDVPPERVPKLGDAVTEAVQGHSPLSLHLAQGGMFPNGRAPRVVWLGLGGGVEALASLQRDVERALAQLGFPAEERPFRPHLTLARVAVRMPEEQAARLSALLVEADGGHETFRVDQLSLMQSTLRPSGAEYRRLPTVPLQPPLSLENGR